MNNAEYLANILLNRADKKPENESYDIFSALSKLEQDNPRMTLYDLMTKLRIEMPKTSKEYHKYIKNT